MTARNTIKTQILLSVLVVIISEIGMLCAFASPRDYINFDNWLAYFMCAITFLFGWFQTKSYMNELCNIKEFPRMQLIKRQR